MTKLRPSSAESVACVHGACNITSEKVALDKDLPLKKNLWSFIFFTIIIVMITMIVFRNTGYQNLVNNLLTDFNLLY